MLITLDIKKEQLRVFKELASLLKIELDVISNELSDEQENMVLYNAMQKGDQNIVSEKEQTDFENWLDK